MWFVIGNSNDLKRVPNGKRLKLTCLTCKAKATFYEAEIEKSINAYVVLKLWSSKRHVMQCGECLGVCDYSDIFPDEVAGEEQAKAAEKQKSEEDKAEERRKAQEAEQQRAREQAAEKQRQAEAEAQRRKAEALAREAEVDNELAQLKKKLGK